MYTPVPALRAHPAEARSRRFFNTLPERLVGDYTNVVRV
jgi:hypothetical protein